MEGEGDMNTTEFRRIVVEVNVRAKHHPIGQLQGIRRRLKGLSRPSAQDIFTKATTFDEYAYHWGGRKELQFNIGIEHLGLEHLGDGDALRSGVAFSFQPNRSVPDISVLYPKVKRFNEFLELYPDLYADMSMWHWTRKAGRSIAHVPQAIPPELMTEGVFVFLGNRQPFPEIDCEAILNDFDRLLPLYKYVETPEK
jgi:hypothetical protein